MPDPVPIPDLQALPEAVVAAWPAEWPLAVLWSGAGGERGRWTVIGRPSEAVSAWDGPSFQKVLERVATPRGARSAGLFAGGWLGWMSYDAGREIEPAAGTPDGSRDDRGWPLAHFSRVDDALVFDRRDGSWRGIGEWKQIIGGVREWSVHGGRTSGWCVADLRSEMGRGGYTRAVGRVLEYIRAGDVYQANLAHRLSGTFQGSARGLFSGLVAAAAPWYGGYVELMDPGGRARVVASASPELFLEFDAASRRIVTRPMKGTRPGHRDPSELAGADKDRAELNMIVDLMRNDLGRVCEFGSVRVEGREVERHGGGESGRVAEWQSGRVEGEQSSGLWQATATVSGRVREGLTIADVLRATFPGGSVTGAPKIRAMQIIDELEPVRRGPYCGCFGWIGDDGSAALNVMIRTALLSGEAAGPAGAPASVIHDGVLDYSVGAGIVADSEPEREWEETMDKAGVIRRALGPESPIQ